MSFAQGEPASATDRRARAAEVETLKALSDSIRWRTVRMLARGERCVCELNGELGLAQSRLSYHLAVLRDAGLIVPRREGRWVYYSLAPAAYDALAAELTRLAETWRQEGAATEPARC